MIRLLGFVGLISMPVWGCSRVRTASDASAGDTNGHFSFFVTSLKAIRELSQSQNGFGGDLRFGETGPGAGLKGADKICQTIAETSMPGSSAKQWRAFLSAVANENGNQVNAIDRIGEGPWYDRIGRLFANNKSELLYVRPLNANVAIKNDFPNEDGVPNHNPDGIGNVDNHDFLTGSNDRGELYSATATCKDWTTSDGSPENGRPRVGHSWPRPNGGGGGGGGPFPPGGDGDFFAPGGDGGFPPGGDGGLFPPGGDAGGGPGSNDMDNWMSSLDESGCAPGVNLSDMSIPGDGNCVGCGGGYGGFYCFALTP